MDRRFFINRHFLLLWWGQALSTFGEFLIGATVGVWLVSDLLKDDPQLPFAVGLTVAAVTLPRIVIAPLAGAWIDHARPLHVMLMADVLRLFTLAGFIAASAWGQLTPSSTVYSVCVVLLINSSAAQYFAPARACIMQVIVPSDQRSHAAAIGMFSLTGVGILTAALGPLLFAIHGAKAAFVLAIAGLTGSILCVVRIIGFNTRIESHASTQGYARSLMAGVQLAWTHPTLRLMMAGTALYGISLGINNPVLPLFGMHTLNRTPAEYGVLMAMFPLGGLSATLFSPLLAKHLRAETLTCGALFLLGLTNFAYALSRGDLLPPLTMYLSGVCFSLYATALGPVLQTHVPVGYMARISSLSNPVLAVSSFLATAAVSSVLVHVNADDSPIDAPTTALVVSAVVLLSGAGLMLKSLTSSAPMAQGVADEHR